MGWDSARAITIRSLSCVFNLGDAELLLAERALVRQCSERRAAGLNEFGRNADARSRSCAHTDTCWPLLRAVAVKVGDRQGERMRRKPFIRGLWAGVQGDLGRRDLPHLKIGEGPGHLEDPVDVLAALSVGERHMQGVVRCADSNHSGAVTCDEIGSHLIVPTVWFGPVRQAP